MANWKTIEVNSDKSKSQADDVEDSLNNTEELDTEEDNQEQEEYENEDTDETVDFSDEEEEVLDEDNIDSEDMDSEEEPKAKASDKAKDKKPSRSEERIRELVARSKASDERAAKAEARVEELAKRAVASEKISIDSEILSVKETLERVKKDLKAAVEAGDTDSLIKGQEALSENKVRLMALESSKNNFEAEQKRQPQKQAQRETSNTGASAPQAAINWAEKNDGWFNKNRALTGTALGINQDLLEEGHDPESAEFYQELDKRMSPFKPKTNPPAEKEKALNKKTTPVVNSSSKTVPQKSVKVTPQDQERARRLGISPKSYLRQKAAYERDSQNSVSTFKPIFINKDKK